MEGSSVADVLKTERRGSQMVVWFGEPSTGLPAPGDPASPIIVRLQGWKGKFISTFAKLKASLVEGPPGLDLEDVSDGNLMVEVHRRNLVVAKVR